LNITLMPFQYTGGVRFDPHGLNGQDNAHYLSGTGRVAFGDGGVDDGEDVDVVLHELGHGLHHWVTSGGLSQVNGLSEGCGDYWASSYRRSLNLWDSSDDEYNWVFGWDGHNEFWNGRINNYTALYPGGLTGSIHRDGQIWATSLMIIYDLIGRTQTDKAFLEGLAMTNGSSSQNDAAVAVYNAAVNMNYPTSQLLAIHSTMTNQGYTLPAAPLPVELASFTVRKVAKGAQLDWVTVSEVNNDRFVVERSADGRIFESISTLNGNGTTTSSQSYQYFDEQVLPGINYYRLRQVDLDGTAHLSEVKTIHNAQAATIQMYRAASEKALILDTYLLANTSVQLRIFEANGRLVKSMELTLNAGTQWQKVGLTDLSGGLYIAHLEAPGLREHIRFLLE
ncbi:MAG: hypothetical protein AAGD05_13265, partial [Bacteroidota bacterium]